MEYKYEKIYKNKLENPFKSDETRFEITTNRN